MIFIALNLKFTTMHLQLTIRYVRGFIFTILFSTLFLSSVTAQSDTINYNITLSGLASSGEYSPFWLQSNQYGKISEKPSSTNLMLGIGKDFGTKKQLFDYSFKANALVRTDNNKSELYFHELYAKAKLSVLDFTVGAREEQFGNQDSILSSGGFLFSQLARPMPKITIGIEHFTPVPFTNGFMEIKGAISHGWFTDNIYTQGVLLHHKYIYGKFGGKGHVHFQYSLDHVAQWGGNIPGYGQQSTGFKDFINIFFARGAGAGAPSGEQINAEGNHILSEGMRLDVDITDFSIGAYWQNLLEDGPVRLLGNTMNTPDGLWGISIRNKRFPFLKGILYEYLNTTDQSGPYHDLDGIIYGGSDNYFKNYIYQAGWTNYSRIIGTPFITSPVYNKNGEIYTMNNRVQVHHFGMEGDINNYNYRFLASFSKNYGTYGVPESDMKRNTSLLLEINKQFPKLSNIELSCSMGADFGRLYGNSVGILFSIRKRGELFHY
jgi:hypothetical protein